MLGEGVYYCRLIVCSVYAARLDNFRPASDVRLSVNGGGHLSHVATLVFF